MEEWEPDIAMRVCGPRKTRKMKSLIEQYLVKCCKAQAYMCVHMLTMFYLFLSSYSIKG